MSGDLTNRTIIEYDFQMERKLSVTEAARNFSDLINRALYRGESALLTRSGQPVARIVPVVAEPLSIQEFVRMWRDLPHLDPQDAEDFAREIEDSRNVLNQPPQSSWD